MMIKAIKALYTIKLFTFKGIWHLLMSFGSVGMNLMALLYIRQKLSPNQIAINENDNCITYHTLYTQSQHLAKKLAMHCDIKPHQKIAIMANNHTIMIHTLFAIARLGADIYLLNTELSVNQLQNIQDAVKFDWIIHDPQISTLTDVKSLPIDHLDQVSIYSLLNDNSLPNTSNLKVTHFNKLTVLTSGTTGRFKMAGRNSKAQNFISPFYQLLMKLNLSKYNRVYIATPIYHGFGIATLCMSVLLGATIFINKRFDAVKVCQLINKYNIEVITLVPLMLSRMMNYSTTQLRSLRCIITGGAPIAVTLVQRTINQLGEVLYNLYGTSEAGICMIATPNDLINHPSTIGKPITGLSTKLMNNGKEDAIKGELYIKCAWSTQGKNWIATGDIAQKDRENNYYLNGRIDDMIVSGGENVYPFEIEQFLINHPDINDLAVISVNDEEFGQRLVAFVVLAAYAKQSEDTLKDWLKPQIARYQMPKKIYIIDELPMTHIGKVDRKQLINLYCLDNQSH
ncbi:2-succinylbenzoate--CoA ligase [Gilliamella apicola]|uniref:class I adenylate-forming enzyme family protein n=2 Tax=Gilliamella apicola TaxID=1196095 RepID=UPI000D788AB5|nr:AMP-binding protein [Gilliamella apicola]PXY99992.1 2-succinylbenzoate--CoA ligase [Gilliamella apicola]